SLMLNRLMFIYFIQKKGFLDKDVHYLNNRLQKVQQRKGKGKFQTFYRYFLLCLFHEGFSKQPVNRQLSADLEELLGDVPYLNGGLFDVHELEHKHTKIDIPDEAFEKLFAFFDQYEWHLDTRPLHNDREINPDVLGYIFEKYINQKQMGAYYTKEDITDYISKNTILPYLFDAAARECAIAFRPGSALWRLLQENPDRYLYHAMRHGVIDNDGEVIPLPAVIQQGVAEVAQRDGWNRPAAAPFALPTETWREHVARRQRCLELRDKLAAGQVGRINDLITFNLDIRQFAADAIAGCEGPELLRAFYHALSTVTVLDPTCGSGAFLFAALNILQPLYGACLDRMQAFVEDLARAEDDQAAKKFTDFRHILADVARHPNGDYYVLKSIIVHNLYGVDLMEEAVEICKLRLFLKLVAQVERVKDLEPLPDIDFNIRAGNTLVGYVSVAEVQNAIQNKKEARLDFDNDLGAVLEDAKRTEEAFQVFQNLQLKFGANQLDYSQCKTAFRQRLRAMTQQLDRFLAIEYDVDPDKPKPFTAWRVSHQPFHWFAEFYGIMAKGGFHAIIGNPPWKEYAAVKRTYTVRGFTSESCGNLHCLCTERALALRSTPGRLSFIVQLPLTCSSRMASVRSLLQSRSNQLHVIPFDDRPGKLFDGLQHCRSVIFLSDGTKEAHGTLLTTRYQRWPTEARPVLFAQFEYANTTGAVLYPGLFPKYATNAEVTVFRKVRDKSETTLGEAACQRETKSFVFYQEATQYWVKATIGLPYYAKDEVVGAPAHGRYVHFSKPAQAAVACALLNSSLFYAYFIAYGDCFHLSETLVAGFPVPGSIMEDIRLRDLGLELNKALANNATRKTIRTRDGAEITYAEFRVALSKPIIDAIDCELARHYGFNAEELDFLLNYDIKYRLGPEEAEEAE
ncbi:MAG: SAM-dependent methyltransferase, partial [Candidatus Hydrogenedentes bacterium]|nr:SAM-dependent methyltransferase [Candidatus Hydrogenedentota bacterium]